MTIKRRPQWLQKRISPSAHAEMEGLLGELSLHTVCQEALCPNITECFRSRQATFLILGAICTRSCGFCNVNKSIPLKPDLDEPRRVAEGIRRLRLSHVVITSPTRDDLDDGGAAAFSATVAEIRAAAPSTAIELLVPDFMAKEASIATVVASGPDIFGHNIETVPRLYEIRSGAEYHRSLEVLALVKGFVAGMPTKSGIMVGLGETVQEVLQVLKDLRRVKCDYVSIGQYLAPSRRHHNVVEYMEPALFERYHQEALALGFKHVESGPYVRSSYHAGEYGRTQAETAR